MVYIKALKDEILDLEFLLMQNSLIPIGAGYVVDNDIITLFDKEDVIINRIEKLPVLKGIEVSLDIDPAIFDRMVASASETMHILVQVWNGSVDDQHIITVKQGILSVMGGSCMVAFNPGDAARDIKYLLSNEINCRLTLNSDDLIAGIDFPAHYVSARILFDIDWVPVTTDELKTYAVEQLYVNM